MTKRNYSPPRRKPTNLVGKRFGMLSVLSLLGSHSRHVYWLCRCDCGNEAEVPTGSLNSGNTKSCGCQFKIKAIESPTTHSLSRHPMYGMWLRVIQRCEDANCTDYKYYGARGSIVCDSWHSFDNFLRDMGDRPKGGTLERIDNNLGYNPDNCRWATRFEQMQNTRATRLVEFNGKTQSISMWAREYGIKPRTLNARINRLGYTMEQALSKPVKCGGLLDCKEYEHLKDQSWRNRRRPATRALSVAQVLEVRDRATRGEAMIAIGRDFGVSDGVIANAVRGLGAYSDI